MAQAEGQELIPEQHPHSQNGTQLDCLLYTSDACLNAPPLPNSQLGQNLAKPGWNCHHDNFKDSNPNIEWKATLEQAEKLSLIHI